MEEKKHHAMTPTWNGTVIQSIQFPNSWAAAAAYDRSRQLNANQAQSLADSYHAYSFVCGGTEKIPIDDNSKVETFRNSFDLVSKTDCFRKMNQKEFELFVEDLNIYAVLYGLYPSYDAMMEMISLKPRPADLTGRGIKETNETN